MIAPRRDRHANPLTLVLALAGVAGGTAALPAAAPAVAAPAVAARAVATPAVAALAVAAPTDTLVAVSEEVTLRVIAAGPVGARPVVLVPGWCFTADIWSRQIAALGERYRVIAFDPRSQGRSTILDHANTPDARAGDIAALVGALHLRKPVLVGWSQGVQDVAAYALQFGTGELGGIVLVDAAVSAGAAALDAPEAAGTLGRMPVYAGSPHEYLEGMMPYIFKTPLTPGELDTLVTAAMRTPSSVGVANLTLDFYGRDYRKAFERIAVPTLIVAAGSAPDKSVQLAQRIPKATTAVVEGAGHAVFYDQPAKFNELLLHFLADLGTR